MGGMSVGGMSVGGGSVVGGSVGVLGTGVSDGIAVSVGMGGGVKLGYVLPELGSNPGGGDFLGTRR